jgi:hypothetical protein
MKTKTMTMNKLSLRKETLRQLRSTDLGGVRGGADSGGSSGYPSICDACPQPLKPLIPTRM